MDLKASDRVPCKSCGKNDENNMIDKYYPSHDRYYIFCRPCSDMGKNQTQHSNGNTRPEALRKWNAANAVDEDEKTSLDLSKMKDKDLAKKVKALLETTDEEISTTTLNNCPVCNGKMKLMPKPYKDEDGNISLKVVTIPEDPKCINHILMVGDATHANSNEHKWVFHSPEGAIYAFNKLYPRPATDEMYQNAGLKKSTLIYNTRPEDKTMRQHVWDDLNLPEDTELRFANADDWTRVSISPDTLPVA